MSMRDTPWQGYDEVEHSVSMINEYVRTGSGGTI